MRIIAGAAGGVPIQVPKALTRPTTDRVREALFSSLGDLIPEAHVLDLYAGSGALGLESLSRGARRAVFIDRDPIATATIGENLEKTRLGGPGRSRVLTGAVRSQLRSAQQDAPYDVIFADPPYARNAEAEAEIDALLGQTDWRALLAPEGVLVIESMKKSDLPESAESALALRREKTYGKTRVSIFRLAD